MTTKRRRETALRLSGGPVAVVPFPSSLPAAVSAALADPRLDGPSKDHLRALADGGSPDQRALALQGLMEHLTGRDDEDASDDWRLVPALIGIAEGRDGAEQAALLVCAAHLEVGRLVMTDEGDDDDNDPLLAEARRVALRLAGAAVATPIDEEAVLRPLLVVLAAFNGSADLALRLLNEDDLGDDDDDDDVDEDVDDEDEDP
jgi:hypothetical protein